MFIWCGLLLIFRWPQSLFSLKLLKIIEINDFLRIHGVCIIHMYMYMYVY